MTHAGYRINSRVVKYTQQMLPRYNMNFNNIKLSVTPSKIGATERQVSYNTFAELCFNFNQLDKVLDLWLWGSVILNGETYKFN